MDLYNVVLDRRRRRQRPQGRQGQQSPKQNDDEDNDQIRMKRNDFQSRMFPRWRFCGVKLSVLCLLLVFLWVFYKPSSSSSPSSSMRSIGRSNHTTTKMTSSSLSSSSSTTPKVVSLSSLPSFEDGGFIFFLHIPKTGGTTIRTTLQDASSPPLSPSSTSSSSSSRHVGILQNRLNYGFVSGRGGYDKNLPTIERYLRTNPNSHNDQKQRTRRNKRARRPILFLEIHGRDSPNLIELRDTLLLWKHVATQHNISTFFFTILRDPIQYALSYFNFFHLQRKNKNFVFIKNPSELDLLKYSLFNPQCQFLSRGEYSLRSNDTNHKYQPTQDECQHVYNVLLETMDYISITETMDYDILPILSHLLNLQPQQQQQQNGSSNATTIFAKQRVSIKNDTSTNSITFSQLSPSTISTLEYNMSLYDRQLYNTIKQDYKVSFT